MSAENNKTIREKLAIVKEASDYKDEIEKILKKVVEEHDYETYLRLKEKFDKK